MSKDSRTVSSSEASDVDTSKADEGTKKFETLAAALTAVLALFGVGQYFYDTAAARVNDKKERSISYIEQYAESDLLSAREKLADFWSEQPELVGIFRIETISRRSYGALLSASVFRTSKDVPIQQALLQLDNFFTQVGFCRSSGLCNPELLDSYFCDTAQKYAFVYEPFFDRISERTGDTSIGKEISNYSVACVDSPVP